MKMSTNLPAAALIGALAIAGVAQAQTTAAPTTAAPATAAPTAAPTTAAPAAPGANPTVGGVAMEPTKTIVQNASLAPNLTTLVTAVKAAGLDTTLSGPGPFTVFAPTNDAFGRVDPATLTSLMKPENKATLAKVLTYHVMPGTITAAQIKEKITAGNGTATFTTVNGSPLKASLENGAVTLTDVNGNKSYVETPDVKQSNGVVHVVNGVLVPKLN